MSTIDTSAKTTSAEKTVPDFGPANGVKKTKTPRQYDSIRLGALALPLEERVQIKKELALSIEAEVQQKKKDAEYAARIAQGDTELV